MSKKTLRQAVLTICSAALLFSAASANPKVQRDPFVNNTNSGNPMEIKTQNLPPITNPKGDDQHQKDVDVKSDVVDSDIDVAMVEAPAVKVSGIVASSGHRQAIISTNSGSRIVTVGQHLGDYKVKAIDANSVTFAARGQSFRVALGSQT